MDSLGRKLKDLRKSRNLTMEQLADKMNTKYNTKINKGMLSKWENNLGEPSLENMRILANFYQVSLDFLLDIETQNMDKTKKLKEIILSKYGSIREFSKIINIPSATLTSALDKGIGEMADDRVGKICEVLNLDIKTFEPFEETSITSTTAQRIKEGLKIRGMKQSDLVTKTGIGKSSISTYISGAYEPKQTNIYKIAKALDVNESWLMGYDVKMDRVITAQEINLTPSEKEHLKKYRVLDEKGKHTVSTVLDMEYNRCSAIEEEKDYLIPRAAHSDNEDNLDLIRQDLDEL